MPFRPQKSTPKVKNGRVQKKNRWAETPNYWNTPQDMPAIDRRRPGRDRVHLLKKRDIINFIGILPDWPELSKGLNAIVMEECEENVAGQCSSLGVVLISSWRRETWEYLTGRFVREHMPILQKLGVVCEVDKDDYLVKWTEPQAKAFQLLHILLHEFGHHHDRMSTRSKNSIARGEGYAEEYAIKYMDLIWERYKKVFDPHGEHFPNT
jgi:hypothetical protein